MKRRSRSLRPTEGGRLALAAALALVTALVPGRALAQGGPQGQALAVTQVTGLDFGIVLAGSAVQVLHSEASAAQFDLRGPRGTDVFVSLQLPADLRNATGQSIAIQFNSAAWAERDRPDGRTTFDPVQGAQLTFPNRGHLHVWLGGLLSPPLRQAAGTYTATITITAVLN